jgi:hypothetical protein
LISAVFASTKRAFAALVLAEVDVRKLRGGSERTRTISWLHHLDMEWNVRCGDC